MKRMKALLLITLLALLPVLAGAGPLADYGDAPDNGSNFPSLYNTTNNRVVGRRGPYHLDVSQEWLGPWPTSTTTTEIDAILVDGDLDDATVYLYFSATSIPRLAWLKIQLSTEVGTGNIPRYLNVLVDQNRDLEWKKTTLPEWVVVNQPIEGVSMWGFYATPFLLPTLMFDQVAPIDSTWIRLTLTQTPIDTALFSGVGGWDGSGPDAGFPFGETEDHYVMSIPLEGPPPESVPSPPDTIIPPPPPPDSTKSALLWGFSRPFRVKVPSPGSATAQICAKNKGQHPVHVEFVLWIPKWETHYAAPTNPPAESTVIAPGQTACWDYSVSWTTKPPRDWSEPWDFLMFVDPAHDTILLDQFYIFEYPGDLVTWTVPYKPFETVCGTNLTFDVWARSTFGGVSVSVWADSLPAGASFPPDSGVDSVCGTFSWTPDICDAGLYEGIFKAATATDTVTERVDIYVVKLDRVPVITGAPDSASIAPDDTLDISIVAVDQDVVDCSDDMMILSYSMSPTPTISPTFIDSGNGAGWFRWIPAAADTGTFTAKFLVQDLYYWGSGEFVTIIVGETGIGGTKKRLKPPVFTLGQNSPNPFAAVTRIRVNVDEGFLTRDESAILRIYDSSGRLVRTLWTGKGAATVVWDGLSDNGRKATSGVYFYRLSTDSRTLTRKLLLVR